MPSPRYCKLRFRKHPFFTVVYADGSTSSFTRHCSKEVARQIQADINNRIALGTFDRKDFRPARSASKSIYLLAKEYIIEREKQLARKDIARNTYLTDIQALQLFINTVGRDILADQVTKEFIKEKFIDELLKTDTRKKAAYQNGSINAYLKHLSICFSFAKEKGYIQDNPFFEVDKLSTKNGNRPNRLTMEEIERFREYFAVKQPWHLDVFNFALWTGARRQSIPAIKLDQIERWTIGGTKYDILRIIEKGEKERRVPVMDKLGALIERRKCALQDERIIQGSISISHNQRNIDLVRRRAKEGYLFFEIADPDTITEMFRKAAQALQIPGVTFHSTRHTFTTYNLAQGVKLTDMQQLLGHGDIKTTMIYNDPIIQMLLEGVYNKMAQL